MVLLPEPLGPISPRISPRCSSNETLSTAANPPNFLVSRSIFSIGAKTPSLRRTGARDDSSKPPPASRDYFAKTWPLGSGSTASFVLIAAGQTMYVSWPLYCITTGEERSFWPAIWWPGGKNFTP